MTPLPGQYDADRFTAECAAQLPDGPDRDHVLAALLDTGPIPWPGWLGVPNESPVLLVGADRPGAGLALLRRRPRLCVVDNDTGRLERFVRLAEAAGLPTPKTLRSTDTEPLPFPDDAFDTVCRLAPDDDAAGGIPLSELRRVLRPEGCLLMTSPNAWSRKPPFRSDAPGARSPGGLRSRLSRAGFGPVALTGVETEGSGARRYIDLGDDRAVAVARNLISRGPARWWSGVYRATVPGLIAGPPRPPLQVAAEEAAAALDLPTGRWQLDRWTTNIKGKLVASLRCGDEAWILKTALHPDAAASLEAGAAILERLRRRLESGHSAAAYLPSLHRRIDTAVGTVYMESLCRGAPWAAAAGSPSPTDVGLPEALRSLESVDVAGLDLESIGPSRAKRFADLSAQLALIDPELVHVLQAVDRRLAAASGEAPSLRKGDCTLSNVFLHAGRVVGFIDWDETDVTHHRLAPLADLVFSWAWRHGRLDRAATLRAMVLERPQDLPGGLGIESVLERLEAKPGELARGALVSWTDHAYHELQLPIHRLRPSRVAGLLADPCRTLAPLID